MKTKLAIAITAAAVAAHAAPWPLQLQWGSQDIFPGADGLPDVYGPDGNVVGTNADWHAQIVDALDYTVYVDSRHDGDGLGYGFWDFDGAQGVAFQTATIPIVADGRQIFTRIYNHKNPMNATMMADVGYTNFDWDVNFPLPPLPVGYNFGTVSQSDWKVVPEPGAAGLLLVGAAALVFRRMKARAAC